MLVLNLVSAILSKMEDKERLQKELAESVSPLSRKTALITGASSGLGAEFARLFASDGYNLILVARRAEKLSALKLELEAAHAVSVITLPKDLTNPVAPQEIFDFVQSHNISLNALVNNAGIGDWGFFLEIDLHKQQDMIQLNIASLTALTHLFLPKLSLQGGGRILNVASVASFVPGAKMAVYYASKAFVRSFSEALSVELKKTKSRVTATALCPGPVKTEFWDTAEAGKSSIFKHLFFADAKSVAYCGYKAMKKGKILALPSLSVRISVFLSKILPRAFVRNSVYWLQK